jgi:hypothetical protein
MGEDKRLGFSGKIVVRWVTSGKLILFHRWLALDSVVRLFPPTQTPTQPSAFVLIGGLPFSA